MKVYISGKITGAEEEAAVLFQQAEDKLLAMGMIPLNPMKLQHLHGKTWEEFMKVDIKALLDCDAICPLENYEDSRGATLEMLIATELQLPVIKIV